MNCPACGSAAPSKPIKCIESCVRHEGKMCVEVAGFLVRCSRCGASFFEPLMRDEVEKLG